MADRGRAADGIGVSDLGIWQVALTIFGFVAFYSVLAVIEVSLLINYIKLGPQPETSDLLPKLTDAQPMPAE